MADFLCIGVLDEMHFVFDLLEIVVVVIMKRIIKVIQARCLCTYEVVKCFVEIFYSLLR